MNILPGIWSVRSCASCGASGRGGRRSGGAERFIDKSSHERDEIVPHLAVFSSLFGYLLVTIHDSEFYNSTRTISKGKGEP